MLHAEVEIADRNRILGESNLIAGGEQGPDVGPDASSALGVAVKNLTSEQVREITTQLHLEVPEGVLVTEVQETGFASDLGVERGDVILSVNRRAVASEDDYGKAVAGLKSGADVILLVARRNGPHSFTTSLSCGPDALNGKGIGLKSRGYTTTGLVILIAVSCPAGRSGFAQQAPGVGKTSKSSSHSTTSHASTTHTATSHSPARKSGVATSAKASQHSYSTSTSKPAANRTRTYASQRKGGTGRGRYSRSAHPRASTSQPRLARLHLDPDRVKEIQLALTREGYLQGDPTGEWDSNTREAMLRYQTMHGFPATGLPEAKSLMKMGLGPHPLAPELDHCQVGVATGSVITPVQNVFSVSSTNPPNPATSHAPADPNSPEKK